MSHAFLSYVREDARIVGHLKQVLEANGVRCWMDTSDLEPGLPWRDQLRRAIQSGSYFVPFFSSCWAAKATSTANEEVLWAIDELRRRPHDQAWFLSFVLDNGRVPDLPIGADRYLTNLQYISVAALGWETATRRLLRALGVSEPVLAVGSPIAPGLPARVTVTKGRYTVDKSVPHVESLANIDFTIESGSLWRDQEGVIQAELVARAPNTKMHAVNQMLGLDTMRCETAETEVSRDPGKPTTFNSKRKHTIPRGTEIPALFGQPAIRVPYDLTVDLTYSAHGWLNENDLFAGNYTAAMRVATFDVKIMGEFSAAVEGDYTPG
ncbi:toll/interleukin-1 receptor domain-containing protein [uncultured Novosphingobium sp.]|uniref:toll/interleukin-1 receptor domain-containing protein n=1 Tax=uncultured Novosphingobium sp. TaxID=292277 RepID=UPI00258ECE2F|nr:toll/interleukin-1 receptor domain-containing protein [uncultured Novosphingobium sp.]